LTSRLIDFSVVVAVVAASVVEISCGAADVATVGIGDDGANVTAVVAQGVATVVVAVSIVFGSYHMK
jgi:hypothetical protein